MGQNRNQRCQVVEDCKLIIGIFHLRTVVMHANRTLIKSSHVYVCLTINIQKTFQIWRQEKKKVVCKLQESDANQAARRSMDDFEVKLTNREKKIWKLLHLSCVEEEFEIADAPRGEQVQIYSSMLLQLLHIEQ